MAKNNKQSRFQLFIRPLAINLKIWQICFDEKSCLSVCLLFCEFVLVCVFVCSFVLSCFVLFFFAVRQVYSNFKATSAGHVGC